MIIYHSDVAKFKANVLSGKLVARLDRLVKDSYMQSSQGEIISWRNSLMYMNMIVSNSDLPDDAGVAIEYMIPSTTKRIDFLLSGYDENNQANVVVIELKQWSSVNKSSEGKDLVETFVGKRLRSLPHPSYQAKSYADLLEDFNESVYSGAIKLHPCAYLHNYLPDDNNDPLLDLEFSKLLKDAPLFNQHGGPKLVEFINRYVKKGDQERTLYAIENGRIRPSKSLQDRLLSMLKGNQEFIMIDDQKVVFERVISMAEKTMMDNKKRVMIVEGGPGTGKSVISINLLCELTARDKVVHYITKNAAPRNVYKSKLKGSFTANSIDNLFKGSGAYVEAKENELDIAIVDEAHRLNEKSGVYGVDGENQVKEIINSSKCSVFFVDDNQVISTLDIGTKAEILKHAKNAGAIVLEDNLSSQFRCNGSDSYLAWIDDVLQIRETANKYLDFGYDIEVVDDPNKLLDWAKEHNSNNKARIIAGYCWDWPKKERNNPEFKDIKIPDFDFEIAWNFTNGIWAIDPNSVTQAGCIHTSQGLEFEYIGIIIGPDMYFEDGLIKTDRTKRSKDDQSLRGLVKLSKTDPEAANKIADNIIRNTYRTLLTRGMKACRVFCLDTALGNYLNERIKATESTYIAAEELDYGIRAAEEKVNYDK